MVVREKVLNFLGAPTSASFSRRWRTSPSWRSCVLFHLTQVAGSHGVGRTLPHAALAEPVAAVEVG